MSSSAISDAGAGVGLLRSTSMSMLASSLAAVWPEGYWGRMRKCLGAPLGRGSYMCTLLLILGEEAAASWQVIGRAVGLFGAYVPWLKPTVTVLDCTTITVSFSHTYISRTYY
jgi:hypothetical protein